MNQHDFSGEVGQTHGHQMDDMNVYESGQYAASLSFSSVYPASAHWPCILFDLDGVLVDTRSLIVKALAHVANVLDVELPSEDERLAAATLSPRKAVGALFPEHAAALRIFQAGINRYAHELKPCPGVKTLLEQWKGERMAVVTSRNQADARFYLSHSGLSRFFQVVIAWGHTSRHKPHPDPLLAAARRLGQTTGIYVGDTPNDMIAAKAGDFYPIGALWASQWSKTELMEAGAAFVAEQPAALFNHLREKET